MYLGHVNPSLLSRLTSKLGSWLHRRKRSLPLKLGDEALEIDSGLVSELFDDREVWREKRSALEDGWEQIQSGQWSQGEMKEEDSSIPSPREV